MEALRLQWDDQLDRRKQLKQKIERLALDLNVPTEVLTNSYALIEHKETIKSSPYRDYLQAVEELDVAEKFSKILATRIRLEILEAGLPASEGNYLYEE